MRARRLQEAFSRSILPFWNQENASSSQRWKTLAELFNDCSSLSVPETSSQLDSWRNYFFNLRFTTRNWRRQFVFFRRCHRWVSGATVVVMSETASINIIFAFSFVWILQERVIVALLRRLHRSRWRNLYLCGLWHWRYITKLQCLLSSACWLFFVLHLMTRKRFFALSLRLVPATDNFIMLVMIFSFIGLVWTRCLNFQFRLLLR